MKKIKKKLIKKKKKSKNNFKFNFCNKKTKQENASPRFVFL